MKFMKSVPADRKAHGGFEWPAEVGAIVEAPDWSQKPVCGGGLHGLIDGRGDVGLLCKDAAAVWYAFESIDADGNPSDADAIAIDDAKGKCRRAVVRAVGDRATVTRWMVDAGCTGVHWGTAAAGYGGTATAGDRGTATAGDRGTATAGYGGTAAAGYGGTATAGDRGTATAGDGGTATAGDRGTAAAGYGGTATAGYGGTATAGDGGVLAIYRWNGKRWKMTCTEVGENGIEPNVAYRLDEDGNFVKA